MRVVYLLSLSLPPPPLLLSIVGCVNLEVERPSHQGCVTWDCTAYDVYRLALPDTDTDHRTPQPPNRNLLNPKPVLPPC